MNKQKSDWVLYITIRIAVIVCLSTLALGLIYGAGPLTALMRSVIAFVSFLILGWAASTLWNMPEVQKVQTKSENDGVVSAAGSRAEESQLHTFAPSVTGEQQN